MKELSLSANLIFTDGAEMSFNFPIVNPIRVSFWLEGDKVSTFAQVEFSSNSISIGKLVPVSVKIAEREFLVNRIFKGTAFVLGTFPYVIAKGEVAEVEIIRY